MDIDQLKIEKGELAWHDWNRTLKVRKPTDVTPHGGIMAFDKSLDSFHSDAFKGTGVEHLIPSATAPRRVVFDAIDWCGNPIGQMEDCPFGPVGRTYDVQNLGLMYAFYKLTDYGLEMMPDGSWCWWLLFVFDKETAQADFQARQAKKGVAV
jgi:hypothetical protein